MRRPVGLVIIVAGICLDAVVEGFFLLRHAIPTRFWEIITTLLVLGQIILAIGLWKVKNWARWTAIAFALAGLADDVVRLALNRLTKSGLFEPGVASVAFNLWVLMYLLTPGVKKLFLPIRTGASAGSTSS